jgi:hypothetical protein
VSTDTVRPLAFSQQFAVNQILRTLSGTSGMFAVNGPPGTGKTTMLRDVIAAIVVERATELACLTSPGEAFTTTREQWRLTYEGPSSPRRWGSKPYFDVLAARIPHGGTRIQFRY